MLIDGKLVFLFLSNFKFLSDNVVNDFEIVVKY